jgi:hypothetical protein
MGLCEVDTSVGHFLESTEFMLLYFLLEILLVLLWFFSFPMQI